jgi:predicted ribosomally synthesized peptide with nif11-like leader
MAEKNAQAFWTQVRDDPRFRDKLTSAATDEELSTIIIEEGFAVTAEELQTSLNEWQREAAAARQLSDADLEVVAGGGLGIAGRMLQEGIKHVAPAGYKS